MTKAKLLKPLDGDAEGSIREFDNADFNALFAMGAVVPVGADSELRFDGPTIAEYVAAGYLATAYPPQGYASRSTPEEVAAAIAAGEAVKAAPAFENKMAPPVENKAVGAPPAPDADIRAAAPRRKKD